MPKNEWQDFFDQHAAIYAENIFTKNTSEEIEFLLEELALEPGARVLDVGCGTGRHAIELARRGFALTGVDLSEGMLAKAAEAAETAGVQVELVHADATEFSRPDVFDAAICLCEGAFGLLGSGDDPTGQPLAILRNVAASLKPGARAVFTVLSGAKMLRQHSNDDVAAGAFDPMTMTESSSQAPIEGASEIAIRERGFVPPELRLLFEVAGFEVSALWGGTAGSWRRQPLDLDEFEIMVVAQNP